MDLIDVYSDSKQLARCTACRRNVFWATDVATAERRKFDREAVPSGGRPVPGGGRHIETFGVDDLHVCQP